ncbi:hypothetical protein BDD43_3360 [Mucilaginibacter gracilis]|uniref:Tetratricopeptide repeat protein n=1 Tax=Mucilaginibacter gracilis TaxID=423350 RepID=A0A495J448_9SPHI|nr:hypothetical protein [Mucilaginibacter gracilis]RKR83158.1 hypothetical protein BDD43_3360 [Mucilaginibacter gracilis]
MNNNTYTLILILSALFVNADAKSIDSLQKQLDTTSNACVKAELYTNIADQLIQFNGPKTREITYAEADRAIACVLKAIHYNARNNDTLALRNNFNCLASAYVIQHKYAQAKWFVLQSNYISRARKDVYATINSLMQLATIKIAIKDYKMAEKDFNEAIVLSKYKNDVLREIAIEKCLATLYDNTGRAKLAVATEKHCTYLAANLVKITAQQAKQNQVRMVEQAKIAAQKAKANAVKMALVAKINQANQAKIALQKAKTHKAEERKYLALLKAKSQWPLPLTFDAKPLANVQPTLSGDAQTKADTATVFAVMQHEK